MAGIERIVSGAQSGADRAALDFAIAHRIPHGGWCPAGRKSEDGPINPRYKLQETPSSNYLQRTEWNARDSDGTVVFSVAPVLTGGSKKTVELAHKHQKPVIHIAQDGGPASPEQALLRFIQDNKIKVLNVAGPRASKEPEVASFVKHVLETTLVQTPNQHEVTLEEAPIESALFPWPQAGDVLFKSDDDWWMNACLNYSMNKWDAYALGYKSAADIIVGHVAGTHREMDLVVYPVAFLYRHYLELRLKQLIITGSELLNLPRDWPKIHSIDRLWELCRQILEQVWPGSETDALNAVNACINEFAAIDPLSMGFRYPETNTGENSIPEIKHINLRNLQDVMNRVSGLLECASTGISAYLDNQQ